MLLASTVLVIGDAQASYDTGTRRRSRVSSGNGTPVLNQNSDEEGCTS